MSTLYFRQFPSGYYSNRNLLAPPIDRGEDTVIAGADMLHHEDLTWKRRPGFTRWYTTQIANTDAPLGLFAYNENLIAKIIADGETTIKRIDDSTSAVTLYTKSGVDLGKKASFTATDKYVYFVGQGTRQVPGDITTNNYWPYQYKFGDTTTRQWGIDIPTVVPTRANQAGTLDAVIGYRYKYVWKDCWNGHISSASEASASTDAQTNQDQIVTVRGTTQARVDKIDIYRTKDGGSTFYYLATINNPGTDTDTTYIDSTADSGLNTALICPSRSSNNPPWLEAVGGSTRRVFKSVQHQGRVCIAWLAAENDFRSGVNFSTHEIDGLVNGVAHECFPPDLTFKFPGTTSIASSSFGLLVFTVSGEIYLVTGQSKYDFVPSKIYDRVPVLNPECVAQDGDTFFVFTAGKDIVRLSSSTGVDYIGRPLSSTDLASFDPNTAQLVVHRVGKRSFLFLSDASNSLLCYNLVTGTWSTPWSFDGTVVSCNAIVSGQTSSGIFDLLIGPKLDNAGYIWKMDESTNQDDDPAAPVTYPGNLTFGSLMLANPGQQIGVDSIITETSAAVTPAILVQEISGAPGGTVTSVGEPPLLTDTSSYVSETHYFDQSTFPLIGRHLQVKLTFPAANDTGILYSMGINFKLFGKSA